MCPSVCVHVAVYPSRCVDNCVSVMLCPSVCFRHGMSTVIVHRCGVCFAVLSVPRGVSTGMCLSLSVRRVVSVVECLLLCVRRVTSAMLCPSEFPSWCVRVLGAGWKCPNQ